MRFFSRNFLAFPVRGGRARLLTGGGSAALAVLALCASNSNAAQVSSKELRLMVDEALQKGFVRAMVNLDETGGKTVLSKNFNASRSIWGKKESALLAELGANALRSGYWNNGLGQAGMYVNSTGLNVLLSSANAQSFSIDPTTTLRSRVHDLDGSLDEVAALIKRQGFADVELVLNHDAGEFDLGRDGKTVFKSSPEFVTDLKSRVNKLATAEFSKGLTATSNGRDPIATTLALLSAPAGANLQPTLQARIDNPTFLALREFEGVRAIRPIGFLDKRAASWSKEPLSIASATGNAEVLIGLRGGMNYTPRLGYLTGLAKKSQFDAHRRAFDSIFAGAGIPTGPFGNATDYGIGVIHARLSAAELSRLYADADPRILSVTANKPVASAHLTNSTGLINLPPYWANGNRGAGQNIVVIDTGILKSHQFFTSNGATKVVYEACYGTNAYGYESRCLNADALGDSPAGLIGSGEPPSASFCLSVAQQGGFCGHGSHVAGIAAGRASPVLPTGLQGVAPDASLVSINVFSYQPTGKSTAFSGGILAALNLVRTAAAANTVSNPLVVNMSLGGDLLETGTCGGNVPEITSAIQDLASRGVPVVVSTGNGNNSAGALGIAWPSCIPTVIKVGAVTNDAAGTQVANYSNLGIPGNYGSDMIFLAPGGGNPIGTPTTTPFVTSINSAGIGSNTQTVLSSGTSMAAPHVAGLYAILKSFVASNPAAFPNGLSVADLTGFIAGSYSIPVTAYGQTYRRIRMP